MRLVALLTAVLVASAASGQPAPSRAPAEELAGLGRDVAGTRAMLAGVPDRIDGGGTVTALPGASAGPPDRLGEPDGTTILRRFRAGDVSSGLSREGRHDGEGAARLDIGFA